MRLMVQVGEGCATLANEQMRNLPCRRIEVDEIWAYVGKKQRHVTREDDPRRVGDMWQSDLRSLADLLRTDRAAPPVSRGGVVDGPMEEVVADAFAGAVPVAGDAVADPLEAGELRSGSGKNARTLRECSEIRDANVCPVVPSVPS
jgi:hypothetical protein